MGCTPSHSVTASHSAKHGSKHSHKGVLPVDSEGEGVSLQLLIKGSSSYDIHLGQGETQGKDHFLKNTSDEDKNFDFHSSSEDPSLPQAEQEEKDTDDRLVSVTEIAMSDLIESYQYLAENTKKQSFCKSQKTVLEDKNENSEKKNPRRGKKQKNREGKQDRHCKTKEKNCATICKEEKKVDFPDLLVMAHQNAYAYLNPSLSKYEFILCMAHQATETQLSVQQMVSFLLFRFDEINHLLEEIAKEGEDLLKEVGENLSWPADKGNSKKQPDLLQQLLQYIVNKMQLLNGTVASLTSEVLQESCSFLQSAGSSLEEKLKAKQGFDERLLRTIKLLEMSIFESSSPHPDDRDFYSEDSGIVLDSESVKDLTFLDKQGIHASCDASSPHQCLNETICSRTACGREQQLMCPSVYATTRSHDGAVERRFQDVFYPPSHSRDVTSASEIVTGSIDAVLQHQNIDIRTPFSSVRSTVIQEDEGEECESTDASSTSEDNDDNSLSEEESDSLWEIGKDALVKTPITAPASKDFKQRLSTKQMDSPETEKIILKMKDAISEKIKFVPAKPGKREWIEDENGRENQVQRPSTATRSQKTPVKQRRSRSAESLKSQAEDPTLLELQRTQKKLSKKLEMFYTYNETKETKDTLTSMNQKELSKLQDDEHVPHRSPTTNKLKASLAKNFSILPNQDKVPLHRQDQSAISKMHDGKLVRTSVFPPEQISGREYETPGSQRGNYVDCAPPRKSVKKLIETFSPAQGLVNPLSTRTLGPIKCIRKFGLPSLTPNLPFPRGLIPLNQKHRVSPIADINCPMKPSQYGFDPTTEPVLPRGNDTNDEITEGYLENLPPPPPEMLAGLSFDSSESAEGPRTEDYSEIDKEPARMAEHCTTKKMQRMKASLCPIDLLPNKSCKSANFIAHKMSKNVVDSPPRKYSLELNSIHTSDFHQEAYHRDYEMKEAEELYRQNHKIIPLQNPKEIPEQNGNDTASKEREVPVALAQKQSFPDPVERSEKTTGFVRCVSPTRTPFSPTSEKSPPLHHRRFHQASSPMVYRHPSPPLSSRATSPPTQRKLPSPPTQQKLPSPPVGWKQHSPPARRKVWSPPSHHREPSPPPFSVTPSPPASPSQLRKGLQNNVDSGDEQQPPSPKIVSNAHSVFCPVSSSLFEAKPASPALSSTTDAILKGHPEKVTQRNKTKPRQYGEQEKKMVPGVANSQRFVRRSFSDRSPGFSLPLLASSASEPVLSQASMEEKPKKEVDPWNSSCFSEVMGTGKSSSHLELYIVGQGLQKD